MKTLLCTLTFSIMIEKIIAGGGIVENEKGEVLFLHRRGKWDLPKGKLDTGETIENCAVREVMEETGLADVQLAELIDITHHVYSEKGKDINKETYWYAMKVAGKQNLIPQTEEDITEIKWVDKKDLHEVLSDTYQNIVEIVEKYLRK